MCVGKGAGGNLPLGGELCQVFSDMSHFLCLASCSLRFSWSPVSVSTVIFNGTVRCESPSSEFVRLFPQFPNVKSRGPEGSKLGGRRGRRGLCEPVFPAWPPAGLRPLLAPPSGQRPGQRFKESSPRELPRPSRWLALEEVAALIYSLTNASSPGRDRALGDFKGLGGARALQSRPSHAQLPPLVGARC